MAKKLFSCIYLRGDNELIPNGDTEIICGDYLTIMTDEEIYQELLDSI